MPDADKQLTIGVKTTGDPSGAKAVGDELNKTTDAAQKSGKASGDAGEKAKLFAGHMGEVHRAARELSHEFPLAAEALRVFADPVTGAITGAIIGFGLAKKALDDWNAAMDETAKANAAADFAAAITAVKDAMEKGAEAAASYADKMAHLVDPEEQYARALQNTTSAIREQASAQNELGDAAFGLDVDKLKLQLEQGLVSQEQYFIKLGEMEKQHEAEKLARQVQAEDDELDVMRQGLEHQQAAQGPLDAKAKAARSAATTASVQAEKDAASLDAYKAKIPDAQKKADEAEEKINKLGGLGAVTERANNQDPFASGKAIAANQRAEYEAGIKPLNELLDHIQKLSGRLGEEKATVHSTESAAGRAEGRSEKNADRLADAIEKFNETIARFDAKDASDAMRAGIKNRDTDVKTATELTHAGLDPGAAQRAGAGGQVVSDMVRSMPELNSAHAEVATHAANAVTETAKLANSLSQLGATIISGHGDLQKQILDILKELEQMNSRHNSTANNHGPG